MFISFISQKYLNRSIVIWNPLEACRDKILIFPSISSDAANALLLVAQEGTNGKGYLLATRKGTVASWAYN